MASSVAAPLERQFGQIAGVTQMTSTNTLGSTRSRCSSTSTAISTAPRRTSRRRSRPPGRRCRSNLTKPPTYKKVNPADSPILILAAQSDTLPLTTVDDYADNVIAQQISQIPGVAQVMIGGEQKPAIRVQVDPAKLPSRGLTLEDVRGAARQCDDQLRQGPGQGRPAELHHRGQRPDRPRPSSTTTSSSPIATARRSACAMSARRSPGPQRRHHRGACSTISAGVMLIVFKQPGANVIDTVDQIKAALPRLYREHPAGMKSTRIVDRTDDHPRLGRRCRVHAGAHHRASW